MTRPKSKKINMKRNKISEIAECSVCLKRGNGVLFGHVLREHLGEPRIELVVVQDLMRKAVQEKSGLEIYEDSARDC